VEALIEGFFSQAAELVFKLEFSIGFENRSFLRTERVFTGLRLSLGEISEDIP
jgi:hypothetical protein